MFSCCVVLFFPFHCLFFVINQHYITLCVCAVIYLAEQLIQKRIWYRTPTPSFGCPLISDSPSTMCCCFLNAMRLNITCQHACNRQDTLQYRALDACGSTLMQIASVREHTIMSAHILTLVPLTCSQDWHRMFVVYIWRQHTLPGLHKRK